MERYGDGDAILHRRMLQRYGDAYIGGMVTGTQEECCDMEMPILATEGEGIIREERSGAVAPTPSFVKTGGFLLEVLARKLEVNIGSACAHLTQVLKLCDYAADR
ncbi:Uncharacterised protein r2_g3516 [Pycnogonum litorale]